MFLKFGFSKMLLDEAGEGKDGGAGAGTGAGKTDDGKTGAAGSVTLTKEQFDAIMSRLPKDDNPPAPKKDDDDLAARAKAAREKSDGATNNTKALEAAIAFNMNSEKFLKDNSALLPKEINDIFEQANRETYDSAAEKASAIKAAVIQSFFAVQSNLDFLTPALKSQLDDYLKLSKTGKQEKANQLYDTIFEPAFESLKRVKKAEALGKGYGGSNSEDAYKNKLMHGSKKHYLGETK